MISSSKPQRSQLLPELYIIDSTILNFSLSFDSCRLLRLKHT